MDQLKVQMHLSGLVSHSSENGQVQKLDWKWVKKEKMSKEKLWKTFRKSVELLLETILKDYN